MLQPSSIPFFVILFCMTIYSILKPLFSKDKSQIWSPITIIALCLLYYVIIPAFGGLTLYNADNVPNQYAFYLVALVFYSCVLFAFHQPKKVQYNKWNNLFENKSVLSLAIILFIISMICYIPYRGFRTSISASDATLVTARTGFVSYFIDLISLLVASCCLALIGIKKGRKKFCGVLVLVILLYFTLVLYIVGGFRYRLVILILALVTTYHLYPFPRRINYAIVIPIAVIAYLGFTIMDSSRSYGRGIDLDLAKAFTIKDASKGPGEANDVCCFSIAAVDNYLSEGEYARFEPIITAILMPIPRSIFPEKPSGEYMHKIQQRVIGDASAGAAYLVFVEAFASFAIWGVILYGLFIGWICNLIWRNYQNNKDSVGAVLLLSLFNGFIYTWMSRGYMGGAFNDFIYFVVLPFWIVQLLGIVSNRKVLK